MSKKTKKRENAPNQIVGVVTQTDHWYDPTYYDSMSCMTVLWTDGTESKMPMPIIAKPGDRFVFTIEPV